MNNPNDLKTVDKRLVPRMIETGRIDEKEYDKYLKSLPDLAEKATAVEATVADDGDIAED